MKKKVSLNFTPSPYQEKIFDWIQHGEGNAVVSALAGSGKTTCAVAALRFIPAKQKCLFIAFNKSIAEELKSRTAELKNVYVRTSHSLGFLMLRRELGENFELDEYKYRTFLKKNIKLLSQLDEGIKLTKKQMSEYLDSITQLINFARFNLAQTESEIYKLANKYGIPVLYDECKVVLKCLEWGKKNTETIDYTDMVWLPIELSIIPYGLQYDWIFVDECQDLSIAQIELFKKCFKRGTRFLAIGDENQNIYTFAGSSEEAFNTLKNQPNTQLFPLPITYRCSKKVVEYANDIVPDLLPRENAPEGEIRYDCHLSDVQSGDMVLCRTKSPLFDVYERFLKKGINCYINGNDIGKNLIELLESYPQSELNPTLNKDGLFVRLYDDLFTMRNRLMETRGLDYRDASLSSIVMERYDTINALITLTGKLKRKYQLIEHVKDTFKEKKDAVCLSTVHKAKGGEAKNVFIICHSLMPSNLAILPWEKQQEANIEYVAYTRAKESLCFISEKEVRPTGVQSDATEIIKDMKYIENRVCRILGKQPMQEMNNAEIARIELQNVKPMEDLHEKDNKIVTQKKNWNKEVSNDELLESLSELFF
jgi:superfamily I DNA/RNA helicase